MDDSYNLENVARELNSQDAAGSDDAGLTDPLNHWLAALVGRHGSDLLLVADAPPCIRVDGEVRKIESAALDGAEIEAARVGGDKRLRKNDESRTFAGGFGVPRWLLSYLKKRRETKFLHNFPDAVDVIVRGVKAGLPLGDCLRIIASEAPEPVKSEFQTVVESQTVGISMGDACAKLYERMPLPEANFFGIVVSIQQRAGGNLSEALGNLSRVLRDRKKMKAKIQAMSMEAKASAAIIAALPIAVMTLVYITSPQYIELLWTHPTGRFMLACCAAWMSIGVMVMRKMINFDF
jgi:tight adherence protein B